MPPALLFRHFARWRFSPVEAIPITPRRLQIFITLLPLHLMPTLSLAAAAPADFIFFSFRRFFQPPRLSPPRSPHTPPPDV
jgi:hypothetical protein